MCTNPHSGCVAVAALADQPVSSLRTRGSLRVWRFRRLLHAQNSRDGCPLLGNIPLRRFADRELVDGVQFVASQPFHKGERDVEAVLAQQSNHGCVHSRLGVSRLPLARAVLL